eukprot:m.239571 g.239571  ORF g.239571 m.239571 type:complete len:520 (+) comp17434_c0_seq10:1719-3278(+)
MHTTMAGLLVIVLLLTIELGSSEEFAVFEQWNSIPSGSHEPCSSLDKCRDRCTTSHCLQFSYNEEFNVCFISNSTVLGGLANDHIISGCLPSQVLHCPTSSPPPPPPATIGNVTWTVAGAPEPKEPFCGFPKLDSHSVANTEVYHAVPSLGTYNHAAMIGYINSTLFLTWKNSPVDEDQPGQRILYSYSHDGVTWANVTDESTLFPNVSNTANPAALFAGPTVTVNGHHYASASPHQFCLFPYPYSGDDNVLLLRRIVSLHPPTFGPIFWAAPSIPSGFEQASSKLSILPSSQMDAETQGDLKRLNDWSQVPCDTSQTTKCEACQDGCDVNPPGYSTGGTLRSWGRSHDGLSIGGSSEETHYKLPNSNADVILRRTSDKQLAFTYRHNSSYRWSSPLTSGIPDDNANLNAGQLENGTIYLLSNACPTDIRDPVVLSLSHDGRSFAQAFVAMSCHDLSSTSRCMPRHAGKAKGPGPSYPQGVLVRENNQLYVVATNNKEDVWVTRINMAAVPSATSYESD